MGIIYQSFMIFFYPKDAVSQFQSAISVPSDSKPPGSAVSQRKLSQECGTKKSQLQLITGAIKRKRYVNVIQVLVCITVYPC